MSLRQFAFGGVSLAALFAATAAIAQPPPADVVDELIVTATSLEQTVPLELSRQGHDLVIIDDDVIREKVYPDLSSALQMEVPGLYLGQQAGPFSYSYVSIQGSRTQDMLWTVDGIRVNNRLYSGTLPTDTMPASMVERIEVLKGGEGLFYGTQGVAGVVNLVTRGFTDGFNGQVTAGADTNDGYHLDGYMRGSTGPHKFVAFLSMDEADGYPAFTVFQPSATLRDRAYKVFTGGLKYGIDLTDDLSFSASWIHNDADLDYPAPRRVAYSRNSRDEEILGVKLDYTPDEGLKFYIKGYHHDWDSRYTTKWNDMANPGQVIVVDDNLYWGYKDTGVNALAELPMGGFDILGGYDFQTYEARDEVLVIDQISEDVHAVFGQIRTNSELSDRFNLAAGVRYNKTGENTATVWNLSGRADLTDSVYVLGNIGTSFILPTAENLFAVDPFSTFGNPFLEPEEGRSYNLSIGGRLGDAFEWQLTGFRREIDNLITFETDPALIPDVIENHPDYSGEAYVNAGEAEFEGFEILGSGRFNSAFSWSASYTRNEARLSGTTTQIQRIPETVSKVSLGWNPEDLRFGGSATAIWVGDVFVNLGGNQVNYGDYYVVDLAAYAYLDDDRRHQLVARLENAFDEDYVTRVVRQPADAGGTFDTGYRGVPRTFRLRYSYRFGD